jgi:acid phosphatase type 7
MGANCCTCILLAWSSQAFAAELVRGPYLQLGTPTSVAVKWRTDVPTDSLVRYGFDPGDPADLVIDHELTTEHEVTLADLAPDTKYFYSVGSTEQILAGGEPVFYFRTFPIPGRARPTRIWAIGDCGTAAFGHPGSAMVRDAYYSIAGTNHTDVWLMLGDNAYSYGTDEEYQIAVFDTYREILRNTILWSCLGNHETYGLSQGGRFAYHDIFSLPAAGEAGGLGSGTENYYSFDHANVHFVCLDSEISDLSTNGAMWTWLEADLAANTNEWLIAFWHSPPYTMGSHNSDDLIDSAGRLIFMRENFVPLLESHGVDLVLGGHSHSYERSYLIHGHYGYSFSLMPEMVNDSGDGRPSGTGAYLKPIAGGPGTVYVVAGSSGWATHLQGQHPAMYVTLLEMGSMILDINGNRMDARFLRETGATEDHFTIIKGGAPEPFRLCTLDLNGFEVIARWKSEPGRNYVVQQATTLAPPNWLPFSNPIQAYGATTSWTNYIDSTQQAFYRVQQLE